MKMNKSFFIIYVFIILNLVSCNNRHMDQKFHTVPGQNTVRGAVTGASITFVDDIQPLFEKNCSACHNASSAIPNWSDYNAVVAKQDRLFNRVIVVGDMPLGLKLSDDDKKMLATWLKTGLVYKNESQLIDNGQAAIGNSDNPGGNPIESVPPVSDGNIPSDGGGSSNSNPTIPPVNENNPIPVIPNPSVVDFSFITENIFTKYCSTCHYEGSPFPNWNDYQTVLSKVDRLKDRVLVKKDMPMGIEMPDADREILRQWLDAGAPN